MTEEADVLGELDPDDPRQASQQIAARLRAAILTRRFEAGDRLPSQPELAARYGVARETVKRALDLLRAEQLIVTRQGSGAYVRATTQRPVELRPHIEAAFQASHVTLDFAGFSGETLQNALAEPLDQVRAGRFTPLAITVRLLLAQNGSEPPFPVLADTGQGDGRLAKRARDITHRAVTAMTDQVCELASLGLVKDASVTAKTFAAGPAFKLYVINQSEIFFGFYPVHRRSVQLAGEPTEIFDLLGRDVPLFHMTMSDDDATHGRAFVESARHWFESTWSTVAAPATP